MTDSAIHLCNTRKCRSRYKEVWGAGFATFWYPGGSRNSRASLLPWHVFFGVYIYVLAVAACVTGLFRKSYVSSNQQRDFALLCRSDAGEYFGCLDCFPGRFCYSRHHIAADWQR
ncbi:putative ascorbate ferrireductase (transmembrane) [Helianthus annuus]|nr:putative ascorbate ferrireductase (transmembrane) [Helianthus annuus]